MATAPGTWAASTTAISTSSPGGRYSRGGGRSNAASRSAAERRASRDPLSTMVAMAIDVGRSRACAGSYPAFDGRFHYLLELGDGEIADYEGGGYEGEVLKCELSYIAISGFEQRDAGRRRIPRGQVWFALMPDSTFAPPVRISTPLSAGGATIRLASFRRARVDVQYTTATTH